MYTIEVASPEEYIRCDDTKLFSNERFLSSVIYE